jgi:hypothetical protein
MALSLPDTSVRLTALVRHNATLMLREPGPVICRLVQPLVLITLMHPLYAAALAAEGAQAGTVQVVTGMLVMFSLLALSVVGSAIMTERSWLTWDRIRATPARPAEMLAAKGVPALALLVVLQAEVICFAPASPGYWAMGSLRSALHGQAGATLRDAAVLAGLAVAACAVAAWRMSRTAPRSRLL